MQSTDHACRYVIIDVETTGLRPGRGGRVIEVGAVAVESQEVVGEFHSLVRVNRSVPLQARRIHGISDAMLMGQPTAEEVFPRLRSFAGDAVFVAHNAVFDIRFLRHEFGRLGLDLPNRCLCTLEMSRRLFPQLRDHKLETVYRHLFRASSGVIQQHRALDDARMVAKVWMEMMRV
jgi:DNA polymerase III subunit epsilon